MAPSSIKEGFGPTAHAPLRHISHLQGQINAVDPGQVPAYNSKPSTWPAFAIWCFVLLEVCAGWPYSLSIFPLLGS